jgi:hypothetical protein
MEMEILIVLYILNQEFYREELCMLEDLIKTMVIDLQVSLEDKFLEVGQKVNVLDNLQEDKFSDSLQEGNVLDGDDED